ncbi:MAG: hypothetical protein JJV97_01355 [SAR324 cluster bacterium]|nr:hypothetical protein [SAR324 cluster bacterium]
MSKIIKLLVCLNIVFFVGYSSKILAQSGFEVVQAKDVEIFTEASSYSANVLVHGGFDLHYKSKRLTLFGQGIDDYAKQRFHIDFESIVFADTTFFLRLANRGGSFKERLTSPYYQDNNEADITSSGASIFAKQFYLEYRHNPLVKLIYGRQEAFIGDKIGLVYRGDLNAITQACTVGSWCYYIGISEISEHQSSGIDFVHINYPIYDQEETVADLWLDGISKNRLEVEVYIVRYRDAKVALAKYGGAADLPNYNNHADSIYSPDQVRDSQKSLIFNDLNLQYAGINVSWQSYPFIVNTHYVSMAGKSKEHKQAANNSDDFTFIKEITRTGYAWSLDGSWRFMPEHKFNFGMLLASGNKPEDYAGYKDTYDSNNTTQTNDVAFYEIKKGTFGDANIYFNHFEGFGLGHSVSNLTFAQVGYSYKKDIDSFGYDLNIYNFSRTNGEYNKSGSFVKNIGIEVDNDITFTLSQNLFLKLSASVFIPKEAYSESDNIIPEDTPPDTYINLDAHLKYSF